MRVTCVMVSSLNGYITDGTSPHIYTWTSQEDKEHFFSLIEKASCIIMGRKTYEHAKEIIKHRKGRLRVVLTSNPQTYQDQTIPGQLEFSSDKAPELLVKLEKRGFQEILVVGGPATNAAFLKANCIDELLLTLEPLIFPSGTPLFPQGFQKTKLELIKVEQLNAKGTLLLRYKFL